MTAQPWPGSRRICSPMTRETTSRKLPSVLYIGEENIKEKQKARVRSFSEECRTDLQVLVIIQTYSKGTGYQGLGDFIKNEDSQAPLED